MYEHVFDHAEIDDTIYLLVRFRTMDSVATVAITNMLLENNFDDTASYS